MGQLKDVKSFHALVQKMDWVLVLILSIGFALRLWGINFGLPYTYAADEPTILNSALRMLKTGDLNPYFWFWPSLMIYLNAGALFIYFLAGRMAGVFANPTDLGWSQIVTMGVGKLSIPSELLIARGVTAVFSLASILVVYRIGRRLRAGKTTGIVAALLLAVSPTVVGASQRVAPDIFAMFFALVSALYSVKIVDEPRMRNYMIAGVTAGFAISSKYNAGLILVALAIAHFLVFGPTGWRRKEWPIALVAAAVAFLLTTPFVLIDFRNFWEGFSFNASAYASGGHVGQEGNALEWYVSYLWQTDGPAVLVGVFGALYIVYTRSKKGLVLLGFPVLYFGIVSQLFIRNVQTIMLVLPFLCLFAAFFLAELFDRLQKTQEIHGMVVNAMLSLSCIFLIFQPSRTTIAADMRLTQIDSRETARVWLNANLPPGARVAQEAYTPYVDTRSFVTQGFSGLVDNAPDWYVQNGFEYLVLSEGMYGRWFAEPGRYQAFIDKYNDLFSRYSEIKRFNDNGYEIRVYKTGVSLPAHRVAARYGNEGELVELVGYDDVEGKWLPGQPLKINLTWRMIEEKIEPFEAELRLLDKDDREIGRVRGDLFQGQGWRQGMFSTAWTVPVQANVAPGAYKLEVNVIESQYDYRAPAQTWAGDTLGRVELAPLKMAVLPPAADELQAVRPAGVHFGSSIALLSYHLATTNVHSGASLPLTLYWQSVAKPSRDYTVFVHLVDADGQVVAQVDAQPRGGAYPTSLWDTNEVIRDDYASQLPTDLAPGIYRIEIGMYEYPSLVRLPISDAKGISLGDRWILPDGIQLVQ